ncbi:hypothetical protein PYCCODRAFT_1444654 [Trametes coccinea BRFM310]|uniref:BRCA2 OB1 domain-containing protein n=1 Tax=Trametes coccinea (strain BRFM310) TaxID=1353009 RepID=A0A1Y2ISZ0_TRAC3|nr:hypothetical protein PYCCODRAFT_1444654 [Trametes coccinea BRFM310]
MGNPAGTQERAAEDNFFTTTSATGGGFVSAATIASKPSRPSTASFGFTSAAALPPASSQSLGGFTSAAHMAAPPQSQSAAAAPFIAPKFTGFGSAAALPLQTSHSQSPSPSPPPERQDYDSWFETDVSVLPPTAFAFKTAKTLLDIAGDDAGPASLHANQSSQPPPGSIQFQPASQVMHNAGSSPDPPAEDTTLTGSTSVAQVGFTSAAQMAPPPVPLGGFSSAPQVGFTSASGKSNWAAPSAEALARAAAKMKQWQDEFDCDEEPASDLGGTHATENPARSGSAPAVSKNPDPSPLQTPLRPALRPMENAFSPAQPPDTPSPAAAAAKNPDHFTVVAGMQIKNKPFKSPLVNRPPQSRVASAPSPYVNSPLNPARQSEFRVASGSKLPAAFTGVAPSTVNAGPSTPAKPPSGTSAFVSPIKLGATTLNSPVKSLGMTPRRTGPSGPVGKSKFSTPFKSGMAPGDPGRSQLQQKLREEQARAASAQPLQVQVVGTPSAKGKQKEKKEYKYFDLNPPPHRKTLATCGLRPMTYTEDELEDMRINVEELRQMRPSNAVYYRFHSAIASVDIGDPADSEELGPKAAFVHLREHGCHLATQEWVANHYGLILWKLAGLVCMEPEREQDPRTKRWCWPEVIRQLLYRYERELNGGSRPALRLVSTEDAPAACPMVLCVSNIIIRGSSMMSKEGIPLEPHAELEVTDGWYRLRANIDMPLARAVRRGTICIGTKLAVSGAKLSGDRKEPCEILEAYDNTYLELTGNSTNLAPWHAKLGFVKQPFIAIMDKLTPDGGVVPAMDIIITKAYPIAYVEFVRNDDGTVTRIGPRDEKEELEAQDEWLANRQAHAEKITERLQAHIQDLYKYSERLYSRSGPRFDTSFEANDPMPSFIEGLYERMMENWARPSQAWDQLDEITSGWLHVYCKQQADQAAARLDEDRARELQEVCPPRNVRDFRVVVAKDACWRKKEPMRTAQITLWDPLKMVFSESGNPGEIKEGQRFLVTNLIPNQPSAWMAPAPGAVIYLVSKRTSRWTNIKLPKH